LRWYKEDRDNVCGWKGDVWIVRAIVDEMVNILVYIKGYPWVPKICKMERLVRRLRAHLNALKCHAIQSTKLTVSYYHDSIYL